MKNTKKRLWLLTVPFFLSLAATCAPSLWAWGAVMLSHFLLLPFCPAAKGRESVFTFLSVALSSLPLNAWGLGFLQEQWGVLGDQLRLSVLRGAVFVTVAFSLEELWMVFLSSLIWRKQRKLFGKEK